MSDAKWESSSEAFSDHDVLEPGDALFVPLDPDAANESVEAILCILSSLQPNLENDRHQLGDVVRVGD